MAQQTINIGTGNNTGDGEALRSAFDKCNDNFTELYSSLSDYTASELNSAIRKSIAPYSYTSYLPTLSPYTTPSITASTPTKVLLPTTVKNSNEWAVADTGGGNMAVQYTGATTEMFKIFMSTSITSSNNNVVLDIMMYKNGVYEDGIKISRKISTGADVGSLAIVGEFEADEDDYVEIWINTDGTSTFTFSNTSIIITEKN